APPVHRVATEAVALEPGEDVAQRLVAYLPDGSRRELQLVAVALEVAGLLEALGELAQALEVLPRLLAEQPLHPLGIHVLELLQRANAPHLALEVVQLLQLLHEPHGLLERDLLVAAERIALDQLVERQEIVQVHTELAHGRLEPLVAHHELAHHLVELLALLGRQALHERLHGRHLPADLLDELIEAVHPREAIAPLLLERLEVGLFAVGPLRQHAVQVLEHLAQALHVLGTHVAERLLHPLHEGLEHLLAQGIHQLLELSLGLRVDEVVFLEIPDLAGGIGRQLVELLLVPRAIAALGHPLLDALALLLDDLIELLLDVVEARAEVVPIEPLLALALEPLEQVAQPGHLAALGRLHALLHEPAHRAPRVAVVEHVVGHPGEEGLGVEVHPLRAVPAGVAEEHYSTSLVSRRASRSACSRRSTNFVIRSSTESFKFSRSAARSTRRLYISMTGSGSSGSWPRGMRLGYSRPRRRVSDRPPACGRGAAAPVRPPHGARRMDARSPPCAAPTA